MLARDATDISVGTIVRALERGMKLADGRCAMRGNCRLSGILAEALEAFLAGARPLHPS